MSYLGLLILVQTLFVYLRFPCFSYTTWLVGLSPPAGGEWVPGSLQHRAVASGPPGDAPAQPFCNVQLTAPCSLCSLTTPPMPCRMHCFLLEILLFESNITLQTSAQKKNREPQRENNLSASFFFIVLFLHWAAALFSFLFNQMWVYRNESSNKYIKYGC